MTEPGTRERIVAAATELVLSSAGSGPSVRAVAARAGVGASTLRHYFPSQRDLLDTVLGEIYTAAAPTAPITELSLPVRDRLVAALRNLLDPIGAGEQARTVWRQLFHTFVDADGSGANYRLLARYTRDRVETWLRLLDEQGELAPGDRTAAADFLLTVVNGLAINRVLQAELTPQLETAILNAAASTILEVGLPQPERQASNLDQPQ